MTQTGPQSPVGVPVCPRHPDRESYVRCQRCDRPACPECQRPAAVGVHCVDCVRAVARDAPVYRTPFGARQGDDKPVVTYTIMGLCVLLYIGQQVVPGLTQQLALIPFLNPEQPWRMVTSAFLHSPSWYLHILFNLYALYLLGPYLERVLGRPYFITTYLLAAVGGSAAFDILVGDFSGGAVGASGAVFGLFGVLVIVQRRLNRDLGQIAVVLGINLVLGFVVSGIAWQAHLGGLVVGLLCGVVIAYAPKSSRRAVQVGGLVAVAALVLAASLLGFALVEPLLGL